MFLSPGADCVHVVGRAGSGEPSVLGFVGYGALPVFFLYYARKRCKHLSVLLLLHGLVLACFYIIPAADVNRGIRLLVTALWCTFLWLPFRTEDFAGSAASTGFTWNCLFVSFSAALSGKQRLDLLSYESDPGVFIVCCHLLQSYADFLTVNRLSTGKIRFRNVSFRAPQHRSLRALGLLLLAVSQFAWLKPLLQLLRNGLAAILRFL